MKKNWKYHIDRLSGLNCCESAIDHNNDFEYWKLNIATHVGPYPYEKELKMELLYQPGNKETIMVERSTAKDIKTILKEEILILKNSPYRIDLYLNDKFIERIN